MEAATKLVTFVTPDGGERSGVLVEGDRILDLAGAHRSLGGAADAPLGSVLAIVQAGEAALEIVRDLSAKCEKVDPDTLHRASDLTLAAPIPRPPQMRDFLCFEKHLLQAYDGLRKLRASQSDDPAAALAEMEAKGVLAITPTWYERPIFYHPNRMNVIGSGQDIVWPDYCEVLDFELEFGCYIGRACKDVSRKEARAVISGYTIYNDMSARDEQTRDMPGQLGPGKGKDFDSSNVMGPCLVTVDEIPDPYALEMSVRINGEEWGRGNSSEMGWTFEDCIAHVSRSETLHPGEFFGSGTVGGGCGLEISRFLQAGDLIELEVEKIGVLRNRVTQRAAS